MSSSRIRRPRESELLFEVERDDQTGGLTAVCHKPEMATQGETLVDLVGMIRDLIRCRFDENDPRRSYPVRLHFLADPVVTMHETAA